MSKLNEIEEKRIKELAQEKLGLCRKENDIIGVQIFSILSQFARVIYYPIGINAPWGFTRINGKKNTVYYSKPFVAINSSLNIECQVFAAAHELYHIWFEKKPDYLPANLLADQNIEITEKRANRFAAEFLVDELLLRQEMLIYGIKKISLKTILQLSSLFSVPYRTMVKRLFEIGEIDDAEQANFLAETEESILKHKKIYSIANGPADNRIAMDNLVELSVDAYDRKDITFEKLEYLLRISGLKPEDLGYKDSFVHDYPSDDELDKIMEE